MLDNAEEVTSLFDEHNIPLMIIGGGVMGWARQKEFVPYDFDVDLAIDNRYRFMIPEMKKLLNKTGITLKIVKRIRLGRVCGLAREMTVNIPLESGSLDI